MTPYTGRFAPSPTGPLHLGSLFAAIVSYIDAKVHHGRWIVRIEDLDPPREPPAARASILETLNLHGLKSDDAILSQSKRSQAYEKALSKLYEKGLIYPCPCSRKQLQDRHGIHTPECLAGNTQSLKCALRYRSKNQYFSWPDRFMGKQTLMQNEDVVLKRKDGLYAYQLAVVVDDIAQGITDVVRGIDLLDSTPVQLALYQDLDGKPPRFAHFPLIVDQSGQKLSKQSFATPVDNRNPLDNLICIATLLNMPVDHKITKVEEMLRFMIQNWTDSRLHQPLPIIEDSFAL